VIFFKNRIEIEIAILRNQTHEFLHGPTIMRHGSVADPGGMRGMHRPTSIEQFFAREKCRQ